MNDLIDSIAADLARRHCAAIDGWARGVLKNGCGFTMSELSLPIEKLAQLCAERKVTFTHVVPNPMDASQEDRPFYIVHKNGQMMGRMKIEAVIWP